MIKDKLFYSIFYINTYKFIYIYNENNIIQSCVWDINNNFNKKDLIYIENSFLHSKLNDYFSGKKINFCEKIDLSNISTIGIKIYNEISGIPYGETRFYSEIGEKINKKNYQRVIGYYCKINKFPLIIPCHRVIGKNNIGGYIGNNNNSENIKLKKFLLELEKN